MGLFTKEKTKLLAHQTGRAVAITDVPDPVFADKVLGDGVAIIPSGNEVFSPAAGTVVQIPHSLHAICIEGDDGAEILVHLGIDTVELNGEGFTCRVEVGQHVEAGEKLMDMDIAAIEAKGYKTISPCIITNTDSVKNLEFQLGNVAGGQTAVMTYRK